MFQPQRSARLLPQRPLEAAAGRTAQRPEQILAAQCIQPGAVRYPHRADPMQASTQSRRFFMPRRTQVFTVPSGLRRCAASSPWLRPCS